MKILSIARRSAVALALFAAPVAAGRGPSGRDAGSSPHPAWRLDACLSCHAPAEEDALGKRLSRPCAPLCATCHDDRETHHPTGVPVPGLRAPLLLTGEGKLTCSTCHDVTAPRYRDTAWTSQSLAARLTPGKRLLPTKLLVLKNDRGQLCRSCH